MIRYSPHIKLDYFIDKTVDELVQDTSELLNEKELYTKFPDTSFVPRYESYKNLIQKDIADNKKIIAQIGSFS